MLQIMEVRKPLEDTDLLENLHQLNQITVKMIKTLRPLRSVGYDDYKYANIVVEKSKRAMQKVYNVI